MNLRSAARRARCRGRLVRRSAGRRTVLSRCAARWRSAMSRRGRGRGRGGRFPFFVRGPSP